MDDRPKILAIETTSRGGGIALALGDKVIASQALAVDRDYATDLLPTADNLCCRVGWSPRQVEQVYVSVGPGSFTGTRIGVTFAKTLALAAGAKVVAVPTFEAIALNAMGILPPPVNLVVLMDARQGQVFAEAFRLKEDGQGYETVRAGELVVLSDLLTDWPHPVMVLGEGVAAHRKALLEAGGILVGEEFSVARAEMVHRVGWQMAREGRFSEADALIPVYYRLPTPVEKLQAKEKDQGTAVEEKRRRGDKEKRLD
jgi:tRNA threonylcarbamoyladenosine biosynthesis protein TsaB